MITIDTLLNRDHKHDIDLSHAGAPKDIQRKLNKERLLVMEKFSMFIKKLKENE